MVEDALAVIGHIKSPYRDCFGVPRQPGLNALPSTLHLDPPYDHEDWTRGLESFSHLWVLWRFHRIEPGRLAATVRPPRLGGNRRLGVFATRSPYRPNAIGLSVVPLRAIHREDARVTGIEVSGLDCADGTPILDLKPYLPYAEALPGAEGGFANEAPVACEVVWSEAAVADADRVGWQAGLSAAGVMAMVSEALAHNPAPAYQNDPQRAYWVALEICEVGFRIEGETLTVTTLKDATET